MSEESTQPNVVEGGYQQQGLKWPRMTMISLGNVIGAGLFIGGRQFRSHRGCVIGNTVPKQSASFSPELSNLLGSGSHE
jgi:hypothetical protein